LIQRGAAAHIFTGELWVRTQSSESDVTKHRIREFFIGISLLMEILKMFFGASWPVCEPIEHSCLGDLRTSLRSS
jgi:hypothetical protein